MIVFSGAFEISLPDSAVLLSDELGFSLTDSDHGQPTAYFYDTTQPLGER